MSSPDYQQVLDESSSAVINALSIGQTEQQKMICIFLAVANMLEQLQKTCPGSLLTVLFADNGNGTRILDRQFEIPGDNSAGSVLHVDMRETARIGLGSNPLAHMIAQAILAEQPQVHTERQGFSGFQISSD